MADILTATRWPTNAALIADAARLGYIDDHCLDTTYGEGKFWTEFKPKALIKNDKYKGGDGDVTNFDVTRPPMHLEGLFPTVVFDPPYRLNGTPDLGEFDDRYGTDQKVRWQDRLELVVEGSVGASRMVRSKGTLLVKCMDQVVSGKKVWQTHLVTNAVTESGDFTLEDRMDMLITPRKQRSQIHSRQNYSTLLIFRRNP